MKVRIDGRDIYLPGDYESPESLEAYHRLVAEYLTTGRVGGSSPDEPTINDLIWQFWQQVVKKRYVKNGEPTSEQRSYRTALRPVQELYQNVSRLGQLRQLAESHDLADEFAVRVTGAAGRGAFSGFSLRTRE